ncbi:MAG: glycoside hydrolase family 99-like domain-containing protein [Desulfamplus sp.]|nr:glycoside hydrolase family 99-like domain-containing protein [Desulfamplus sp.]
MRFIAFYLPQYHPIPENDKWWGKDFTDWVNVKKAKPLFMGHYQPHIPADLGFYDLRNEATRIAQAELAKQYGVYGFCYYHYWFNGKMLLETPFNNVIKTGKPDFPFCLCWANENWTKRWDGKDHEILMKQDYANYNPSEHIAWLASAFNDNRYIRINNKPIFLIYKAAQIPNIKNIIKKWRYEAKNKYGIELYLCSVKSWRSYININAEVSISEGFDAVVDFQPNARLAFKNVFSNAIKNFPVNICNRISSKLHIKTKLLNEINIFDYKTIVDKWIMKQQNGYKEFPCVAPSWDNSSRTKKCSIIQNDSPAMYGKWLEAACKRVINNTDNEQIVFINAWNEWAEGCHLEPDMKFGKRFLETTYDIFIKYQ